MPRLVINVRLNVYSCCFLNLVQWYQLKFWLGFMDSGRNTLHNHSARFHACWSIRHCVNAFQILSLKFLLVAKFIISKARSSYSQKLVLVIIGSVFICTYMYLYVHTNIFCDDESELVQRQINYVALFISI
jgi:hypothetical protein